MGANRPLRMAGTDLAPIEIRQVTRILDDPFENGLIIGYVRLLSMLVHREWDGRRIKVNFEVMGQLESKFSEPRHSSNCVQTDLYNWTYMRVERFAYLLAISLPI